MNTSSLGESLKDHTFFIDRCSGTEISQVFAEMGVSFELHDDLFDGSTPDPEWIGYCGAKKRVIITSDREIRNNELEFKAVMRAKVAFFVFTRVDWSTPDKQAAIRIGLPKMANLILHERYSFIARITKSGTIEKWYNHKGVDQLNKKSR